MKIRNAVIAALEDFLSEHGAPNTVGTAELATFHCSLSGEQIRRVGRRHTDEGSPLELSGGASATYVGGRWRLEPRSKRPRKQCQKCPWKVNTNPHEIPNGYCATKHAALERTIAKPGEVPTSFGLHVMACHETPVGRELPCVGWLVNQLGPGNNIALRLAVSRGRIDANVETVGLQHATLQDTLPDNEQTPDAT